jgi:hypothetical protein
MPKIHYLEQLVLHLAWIIVSDPFAFLKAGYDPLTSPVGWWAFYLCLLRLFIFQAYHIGEVGASWAQLSKTLEVLQRKQVQHGKTWLWGAFVARDVVGSSSARNWVSGHRGQGRDRTTSAGSLSASTSTSPCASSPRIATQGRTSSCGDIWRTTCGRLVAHGYRPKQTSDYIIKSRGSVA